MDENLVLFLVFLVITSVFIYIGHSVLRTFSHTTPTNTILEKGGIKYPLCFYYPYKPQDEYHENLFRSLSRSTYVYVSTDLYEVLQQAKRCYIVFFDALPVNLDNSTVEMIYNLTKVYQKIVIVGGLINPLTGQYHKYFFENLTGLGITFKSTTSYLRTLYVGSKVEVPDYGVSSVTILGRTLYVKYLPKDLDCSKSTDRQNAIGYCINDGSGYYPYPYNSIYELEVMYRKVPFVVGYGYIVLKGTYPIKHSDYIVDVGIPMGWVVFVKDERNNNVLVGWKYYTGWLIYYGGTDFSGLEHVFLKIIENLW